MKKLLSSLLFLTVFVGVASAQPREGKFGIGIDGTSSPNLAVKYFISEKVAGEFIVGFHLTSLGGDEPVGQTKVTGTDFRVGIALLYHLSNGDFSPYVGIDAMYGSSKSAGFYNQEPDAKNSVQAGLIVGGEYFIAKQFSIGLKEKLGFDFQLSRDIPKEETDFYINTSTIVTARYYF